MASSPHSSIRFPPSTISSKLHSKFLKRAPHAKDWMHQNYIQMMQDVSYATTHYYEDKEHGTDLLLKSSATLVNKVVPEFTLTMKSETIKSATINQQDLIVDKLITMRQTRRKTSPLSQRVLQQISDIEEANEEAEVKEQFYSCEESNSSQAVEEDSNSTCSQEADEDSTSSDSDDETQSLCHTYTTSSTDCNRRNNIFRYYREQQSLAQPIEESPPIILPIPDQINKQSEVSLRTVPSLSSSISIPKKKRKFKILKRMMTKMRLAAENPFRHFKSINI